MITLEHQIFQNAENETSKTFHYFMFEKSSIQPIQRIARSIKLNHDLIRIYSTVMLVVLKLNWLLNEKDSLPIYIVIKNQ